MSLVWLIPRTEPVPAMQWSGINADDLVQFTEGAFRIEVHEDGSAIGILNDVLVELGHFIVAAEQFVALSPEEVRSRYDAV